MIKILRFIGGFGGDNIIKMAVDSDSTLLSSVNFEGLKINGVQKDDPMPKEKRMYGMEQVYNLWDEKTIDIEALKKEIESLKAQNTKMIIKSHLYIDAFDDVTVDIIPTPKTLSWALSCNWLKTSTRYTHPLEFPIPDQEVKERFILYQTAQRLIQVMRNDSATPKIYIDDLFKDFKQLQSVCGDAGIKLNNHCEKWHKNWQEKNRKYLPSQIYKDMLEEESPNYNHIDLSRIEKYTLLALKGSFKII